MEQSEVSVLRAETIRLALPATCAEDAQRRFLTDGDETGSRTVTLRVDSVVCQEPAPADH
ncbi:hypothetical protein [Streptomyces phaeofaciens]|uniref:hypothetical protein n=1 Tax=Streptomyces phaeofaciens TaxID=68254 RepID=UPI00367AF734